MGSSRSAAGMHSKSSFATQIRTPATWNAISSLREMAVKPSWAFLQSFAWLLTLTERRVKSFGWSKRNSELLDTR
jgi:hypothetical protein